jgi:hypothetical protein
MTLLRAGLPDRTASRKPVHLAIRILVLDLQVPTFCSRPQPRAAPMARRHMLANRGVPPVRRRSQMSSDTLAVMGEASMYPMSTTIGYPQNVNRGPAFDHGSYCFTGSEFTAPRDSSIGWSRASLLAMSQRWLELATQREQTRAAAAQSPDGTFHPDVTVTTLARAVPYSWERNPAQHYGLR